MSLSDVAERLHIRSVYLAAIEDEDWPVIGAPVYVRGFMRTYARFLGIDAEAAVARFSATVPAGTPAATAARTSPTQSEKRSAAERSSPSLAAIVAIVVAAAVVLFVAYEFYQYKSGSPVAAVPDAAASSDAGAVDSAKTDPAGAGVAPADGASPEALATKAPKPALRRGLSIRVTEASWLRITVDGSVVLEGTLPAGTAKSFRGKSADVRVGNAGGVQIAINGKAVAPLGASGDVVERRFVLSGE